MDWFDRADYEVLEAEFLKRGHSSRPDHPVFSKAAVLDVVPVTDGPRPADDPLRRIYRVRRIDKLYEHPPFLLCAPRLLNPSTMKLLYGDLLRTFLYSVGRAGASVFGLAVVGFSLAPQDDYFRQVLYRLVKEYQNSYWDEGISGYRKSPLVLVDYRRNSAEVEQLRKRYAFVDWARTETHMAGLDDNALDLMFGR